MTKKILTTILSCTVLLGQIMPFAPVHAVEEIQKIEIKDIQTKTQQMVVPGFESSVPENYNIEDRVNTGYTFKQTKKGNNKVKVKNVTIQDEIVSQNHLFSLKNTKSNTAIMEYYDEIGEDNMDNALYYISQKQHEDGSFGTENIYKQTAAVVFLLSELGRTDNTQYTQAIQYLLNTEPKDNRDIAAKVRIQKEQEEPETEYVALYNSLLASFNTDGGFGFKEHYASDIITTLEILNTGMRIGAFQAKIFQYLDAQIPDSGDFSATSFGSVPTYSDITRAIYLLEPFKDLSAHYTFEDGTEKEVSVQGKIDILLAVLQARYDEENHRLTGNPSLFDQIMTIYVFELMNVFVDDIEYLKKGIEDSQMIDGSVFGELMHTISAAYLFKSADLEITNLSTVGVLQNRGQFSIAFNIKNVGFKPIDSATVRFFFDEYNPDYSFAFEDSELVLSPGSNANIEIAISAVQAMTLLGDTKITAFVDVDNDRNYDNNWIDDTFQFAAAVDGSPAVPLYFVAFKSNTAEDNRAAAEFIWKPREDSNRAGYVIVYRPTGTQDWNFIPIENNTDSGRLAGFPEGSTYDLTIGVHDGASIYISQTFDTVQVSTDDSLYRGGVTGHVEIDGDRPEGVHMAGYTLGGLTDSDGNFTILNLPNGGNISTVFNPEYQQFYTKYHILPNQVTNDITTFSHLKSDLIAPQMTNISLDLTDGQAYTQNSLHIEASGTDNIAIKHMDFYHWNPVEEYWLYIGTNEAENNSAEFDWYISEELLGDGFKIKAHAYDFRGNVSDGFESEVFSIVNTPISGVESVQVESIENGVMVTWNSGVIPNNFDHFNIYRSVDQVDISTLEPIAELQDATRDYFYDIVGNEQAYYYTVVFVDSDGTESTEYVWIGSVMAGEIIENSVFDGNMEDTNNNWRRWSTPIEFGKTQNTSFSGLSSTYVDASAGHAGIQQLNIPVEAGKSYKFSFRYKSSVGDIYPILGIKDSNADFESKLDKLTGENEEWGYYERDFIVPSDFATDFRVRISVKYGEVYLDDITITEIPALSIVRDGDFESDNLDDWSGWGRNTNWRKTTSTVYAGIQSLEIGNVDRVSGGMYQNNIPLDNDKLYQFSFKYNVGSGVLYTIIGDNSANRDVEGLVPYLRNTHGEWKEYTRIISGSVFTTQNPLIRFSTRNGIAWIDDVKIIEIEAPVMIIDGDMEAEGLGNLENYSNSLVLEKTGLEFHNGLQSLHIQTTSSSEYNIGGVQYRNISVEAGKTYDLSFWYKVNGSLIPRLGINDSDVDFELVEMDVPELDPTTEWALYTRTFTVPEDFTGDFRLVYRLQSWYVDGVEEIEYEGVMYEAPHHEFVGSGELWVDDVSVVEVE
jgi:hypothetical protein